MGELAPAESAALAQDIYDVRSDILFKAFLARRKALFGDGKPTHKKLEADVGGRLFLRATDAFGVCVLGGGPRFANDVFLIFRGTTQANNGADMLSDARIGTQASKTGFAVHIGFNEILKSMLPEIRTFLIKHRLNEQNTIHCVGHSLGGAVATLTADWLQSQCNCAIKLYTFGQPRVGLTLFSTAMTRQIGAPNIHRVFHTTDPVPMVPIFPYTHCPAPGNGHLIDSSSLVISGAAHKIAEYARSMSKKQWSDLRRAPPVFDHERAIEEWLTSKIRPDENNGLTWEWLDRALIYVLKKIGNGVFVGLHTAIVGVHTLADRIAWTLAKGIDLANDVSRIVRLFISKVAQVLRLAPIREGQSITQSFLSNLLTMLMHRAHRAARDALRSL